MDRMVQAGCVLVIWQQVLLEWQRDWARKETYNAVLSIVREHSGAYGMGVDYAFTHVHKAPEWVKHGPRTDRTGLKWRNAETAADRKTGDWIGKLQTGRAENDNV
jgi:hypothetical protein